MISLSLNAQMASSHNRRRQDIVAAAARGKIKESVIME